MGNGKRFAQNSAETAFPQNCHTTKLAEIAVFYIVLIVVVHKTRLYFGNLIKANIYSLVMEISGSFFSMKEYICLKMLENIAMGPFPTSLYKNLGEKQKYKQFLGIRLD